MSEQKNLEPTLEIGNALIDSRYRVLRKLGEGGMGVVYEAEDTRLGRRIAVKLLTALNDNEHYRGRFYREARAASRLNHPHIATVYDYGTTPEGQPFIAMELAEGQTLDGLVQGQPMPVDRAIEIAAQVAEALGEAHRRGIVHRDIKPSNVVISVDGKVKVLDFGLAKQMEGMAAEELSQPGLPVASRTLSGVVIGTPLYLSPEQARGAPVDARSDLFALGSLLYECLTGRAAFAGGSVIEVCTQVIHFDPAPPSQLNPRVPEQLDRICLKALAKDPDARYQSAGELLADLRDLQTTSQQLAGASTQRLIPVTQSRRESIRAFVHRIVSNQRYWIPLVSVVVIAIGFATWAIAHSWRARAGRHIVPAGPMLLYERGTQGLRDGTYFQASKALEQAVRDDDAFTLAHARLAEALMELDVTDRAQRELLSAEDGRANLSQLDQLRLDAIKATVKRDFPEAITAYSELKRRSTNEPGIDVDLGRAYERNYEVDKAMASYEQATKVNSQEAAAFVRLGSLSGRKRDMEKALAAFAQAEGIYQSTSNNEGRAEVFYQRGYLYDLRSKYDDASANLQQSLKIAREIDNRYQQTRTLLQLSLVSCFAGQPAKSQEYAANALDLARGNGFDVLTAQALIGLGSAYRCAGHNDEAEKNFQQGLNLANRYEARSTEAKAHLSLGSLQIGQGKTDLGLQNVKTALSFYEQQGGHLEETMRAQTLVGRVSQNKGDYKAALDAFASLLSRAKQLNDVEQIALSHEGLGTVMLLQERYPEALAEYRASLIADESVHDQAGIGYSSVNCGNALWRLGRYPEADKMFERALSIAGTPEGYKEILLQVQSNRLEEALSQRQFSSVLKIASKVMEIAEPSDVGSVIRVKRALALARLNAGDAPGARMMCEEAVAKAIDLGNPALLYSARLSLAEVLVKTRDAAKALEIIRADLSHFIAANQQESLWRAYLIGAQANDQLGDESTSHNNAEKAREVFANIEHQWGADFYRSYTARKDVVAALLTSRQ